MSEKKANSMGKRLAQHLSGESGNIGLFNYQKLDELYFTYLNFEIFKKIWAHRIEDLLWILWKIMGYIPYVIIKLLQIFWGKIKN